MTYLPLQRAEDGSVAPQEYQILCRCGWRSRSSTSQMVISGQMQDHVLHEWRKASGKD